VVLFRFSSFLLAALACAALMLLAVDSVRGQAQGQSALTLQSRDGRRTLPLTIANGQELVFLDDLASAFQLTVRDESFGAVAVAYKGKSILLTPDQSIVSIAGRLVSLPAPPTRSGRRVLVPVEFISRAFALIYDARLELRKASRVLIIGDWRMPRVTLRLEGADLSRIIIDAAPRTESSVTHQNNSLIIKFEADALDVSIPAFQPQPLVQAIRAVDPVTLAVDLGPRFSVFRATTQPLAASTRLTIDLMIAQPESQPAAPAAAPPVVSAPASSAPPELAASIPAVNGLRAIALDAGHGGDDNGVKGAAGTKEKDLVLGIARRVKAAIEGRLGIRVVLTRDDDRSIPIATRTAIANNNKADLFISVHADASFQKTTSGASILYAGAGRSGEASGRQSPGPVRLPTFGGGMREVDLVPWDLAQTRYAGRSRELAGFIQEQFQDRIPLSAHAVGSAPLDVLESANMPAVIVEMGYLTNEEQEARMNASEFQNTLVQALFDAVLRFRDAQGEAR